MTGRPLQWLGADADGVGVDLRRLVLTLATACAAVGVTLWTADTPWMYRWWYVAPGVAVAALVLGVRWRRPPNRRPWYALTGALVMLWLGWSMSATLGLGLADGPGADTVALLRDGIYVVAYPMLGVASLMMVRARTGGRDRDNVIDALIVMIALATVFGAWLFGSGFAAEVGQVDRLWVTLAPLILAAVVTASLRIVFADGHRLPAAWLLVAASVLTLVGNLWTARLLRDGLETQVAGIDVLWIGAFVAAGAAALHPSMARIADPVPPAFLGGMPTDRLVLLGIALVAGPASQLRLVEDRSDAALVAVGSVIVAALTIWRVSRLLAERDAARRGLQRVAHRDEAVATVGRWALDDRSTAELIRDTDDLLGGVLAGVPGGIVLAGMPDPAGTEGDEVVRFPINDGAEDVAEVVAVIDPEASGRPGDRDFLESIALVLSAAARRRAAEERLRHDALHDPLTGLANRALAIARLTHLSGRRDVREVTAIFLDLDGFKAVNDTLGHGAGDEVLVRVARALQAVVREEDTVARLAGDEFVVLLADTPEEQLDHLAIRLLAACDIEVPGGPALAVTASVGIATATAGQVDAEDLLRRADAAMYRTKREGGGGVTWSSDVPGDGALPPLRADDAEAGAA